MTTPKNLTLSLEELKKTNSRLNRRNQELESVVARNNFYMEGYSRGYEKGEENLRKYYQKKLEEYKAVSRKTHKKHIQKLKSSKS